MDENTYNLLDTLTKIGLGAIIGGLFSFFGIIMNYRKESIALRKNRKIKSLEEIKIKVFNYIYNVKNLLDFIIADNLKELSLKLGNIELSEQIEDQIELIGEGQKEIVTAVFELKLLGMDEIVEDLNKIISMQQVYTFSILKGQLTLNENDAFDLMEDYPILIESFLRKFGYHFYMK